MKLKDLLEHMTKTHVIVWDTDRVGLFYVAKEGNSCKESDFKGILSREVDYITALEKFKISVMLK